MGISKKRLLKMVQESKNRKAYSDYIAVADSDLYDWDVTRRSLLLMIAFMETQDEDKKPEGSEFTDYVGWCWASQRFLANRVGTGEDYISECTRLFEKDGVIETREWTDGWGYPHTEYRVNRAKIDEHKRPDGYMKKHRKRPRRGGNKAANQGSFKPGNTAASTAGEEESHPCSQPFPSVSTAVATRADSRMPSVSTAVKPSVLTAVFDTAANTPKGVIGLGGSSSLRSSHLGGFSSGGSTLASTEASSLPPSAVETGDVVSLFAYEEQKQNQSGLGSKPKPKGKITKGKNVLLNKHTYVDLYEEWKSRVAAGGSSKLPTCNRCGELLQWNEPAHDCRGFVPKYPENDRDLRSAQQAKLRESRVEQMRENSRRRECPDCSEDLHSEEDALAHTEDCPARQDMYDPAYAGE
jgi:hypothetical protein